MNAIPLGPTLPGMPTLPGTPGMPGTPILPGMPTMPGTPMLPGMPMMPGTPMLPGMPMMPAASGMGMHSPGFPYYGPMDRFSNLQHFGPMGTLDHLSNLQTFDPMRHLQMPQLAQVPAVMPRMDMMPTPQTRVSGNAFPTHPFTRSPRDFFMWGESMEDERGRGNRVFPVGQ